MMILSSVLVTIDGIRIGWLDLLTPYTVNSYLTSNAAVSLIYTVYS
jgi:hypothetical protein